MKKINKNLQQLAIDLSNLNGISSREENVSKFIKNYYKANKNLTIEYDNLGSIAIIKKSNKPNSKSISIMAHMDEVGFMVTKIEKTGFIKFTPIGGWWGHVVLGQRLKIITDQEKEIVGIVASIPPHILTPEMRTKVIDVEKMFIDIGATSDEMITSLGIKPGDMIVPDSKTFVGVDGDVIIGKAHDDRAGVAVGMECINQLQDIDLDCDLYFIGSTQEEVGLRGAKTSAFKWTTDISFCLDVTISNDIPKMEEKDTKLRTGVALSMLDRSIIANHKLVRKMEEFAIKHKIDYTYDSLTNGGTDAGAIHLTKSGVVTMTISLPSRYIHSHVSMVATSDLQAAVDLLVNFIKEFKSELFESFINN